EAVPARACRGVTETRVGTVVRPRHGSVPQPTRGPCRSRKQAACRGRHETRARGNAGPGLAALLPPSAAFRLLDGDGGAGALKGRPRLVRALLVDLLQDRL